MMSFSTTKQKNVGINSDENFNYIMVKIIF